MPPEVIAGQVMTGDGGASLTAAIAAYQALVAMLTSEGAAMGATTSATAAGGWEGLGGTAMVATAMPFVAALEGLSAWIEQAGATAAALLEAYNTTRASLIPVPACEANRAAFAAAVAAGIFGWPEAVALEAEYQEFWTQNSGLAGSWEAVATPLIVSLGTPGPPAPLTVNPAGFAGDAAAIAQATASGAAKAGMNSGMEGVKQATESVQSGAAVPAEASQLASAFPGMLSQLPQMLGQFPQMLGQFPQMLAQFPQMAMGMLGPLTSGLGSNAASLAGLEKSSADLAPVASGTDVAARGVGGGGAGLPGGGSAVLSSFTRPTSSFNAPGPPKLPTGWSATGQTAAAPEVATSARPAMMGGTGGLYGAPAMMQNDRGKDSAVPVRTMKLTTTPAPGRGE